LNREFDMKKEPKRAIYDLFVEGKQPLTKKGIAKKTLYPPDIIDKAIKKLLESGIIRKKSFKSNYWELIEESKDEDVIGKGHKIGTWLERKLETDPSYREVLREKSQKYREKRKAETNKILHEFHLNGCAVCGEKERCCLVAHDFSKFEKRTASQLASNGKIRELKEKLDNCISLCRNCSYKTKAGIITITKEPIGVITISITTEYIYKK